jgi:hypothetical protein
MDDLLARANLVIEESERLQRISRALRVHNVYQREQVRFMRFDVASIRTEAKAFRDNKN